MPRDHFIFVLFATGLGIAACGCALKPNYTVQFETAQGKTNFVVHFAPRMPQAWGGEETVYVERVTPLGNSGRLKINHNGRFSETVRVDAGNGGEWARIYLQLERPMVGESVNSRTNDSGQSFRIFRDYHTGQTTVSNFYPWNIVALVSFESRFVINGYQLNSTIEERNQRLIGLVEALPATQALRGETVPWQQTIRNLSE